MLTPDQINAGFEICRAGLTFLCVWQVFKDKGHAGIFIPTVAVFTLRGFWNLYYFSILQQWWSVGSTVIIWSRLTVAG